MPDSMSRDEPGALVRGGTSALQKPSSALVRRTMRDVERLTSDIRILVSERDGQFAGHIACLTRRIVRTSVRVELVLPETIREEDLLEAAARQRFHFAVLFLNNVCYSSGDRGRVRVGDDSVALVEKMVTLFRRPLIGVYAWPDSPDYPTRVLNAGATAVLRAPFGNEAMLSAIRTCLNRWQVK